MLNREIVKRVLHDGRDFWTKQDLNARSIHLEPDTNYCLVGIRRAGKSFMMIQAMQDLLKVGVKPRQIAYINFEDERLIGMEADDLDLIREIQLESCGEKTIYYFLDEIQNIAGWEKFARRLADQKQHISITGSNAKMLSTEIASTLGSRFMMQAVFPYSFAEYLRAVNIHADKDAPYSTKKRASVIGAYHEYLAYGGFPETVGLQNKRSFLNNVYQTIYLGDIIRRNKISGDLAIRILLKKMAEAVGSPISFGRMQKVLSAAGVSISTNTVIKYIGAAEDSCLIWTVENYAAKLAERMASPKYYFMDTGLLNLFLMEGRGVLLENLVALALVRKYGRHQLFFYHHNIEVDFFLPEEALAIQVCYDLQDNLNTYEREVGALVKFSKRFPDTRFLILTDAEEKTILQDGIEISVLPVWKWLLAER